MTGFSESMVEAAALGWFQALGYAVLPGLQLAPGELTAERESFSDVLLLGRLRQAIGRLNPTIPEDAREEALRKLLRLGIPSLTQTTAPSISCCAMAYQWNTPGPMAASPAPRVGDCMARLMTSGTQRR